MTLLESVLAESGGAAHVRTLRAAGIRPGEILHAIEAGRVQRLRTGLICLASLAPSIRRAAQVGGRLAGRAAARHHGFWSRDGALVVALPRHSGRIWDPDFAGAPLMERRAHVIRDLQPAPRFGVSAPVLCLVELCLDDPPEFAIAAADSALRLGKVSVLDLAEIELALPSRARGILPRADPRAESGSESIVRTLLQDAGLNPIPQAPHPLDPLRRHDLLIGDRLIVECDSEAHHGSPGQRRRDLRSDAELAAIGCIVLRFDATAILDDPLGVVAAVLRYVDLGLHLDRSEAGGGVSRRCRRVEVV